MINFVIPDWISIFSLALTCMQLYHFSRNGLSLTRSVISLGYAVGEVLLCCVAAPCWSMKHVPVRLYVLYCDVRMSSVCCIPGWPHTAQAGRAPTAQAPPAPSGRRGVEPWSSAAALQIPSASAAPGSPLAPCTPPQAGGSAECEAWRSRAAQVCHICAPHVWTDVWKHKPNPTPPPPPLHPNKPRHLHTLHIPHQIMSSPGCIPHIVAVLGLTVAVCWSLCLLGLAGHMTRSLVGFGHVTQSSIPPEAAG